MDQWHIEAMDRPFSPGIVGRKCKEDASPLATCSLDNKRFAALCRREHASFRIRHGPRDSRIPESSQVSVLGVCEWTEDRVVLHPVGEPVRPGLRRLLDPRRQDLGLLECLNRARLDLVAREDDQAPARGDEPRQLGGCRRRQVGDVAQGDDPEGRQVGQSAPGAAPGLAHRQERSRRGCLWLFAGYLEPEAVSR